MADDILTPASSDEFALAAGSGSGRYNYDPRIDDQIGGYATLSWSDLYGANKSVSDDNRLTYSIIRQLQFSSEKNGSGDVIGIPGSDTAYVTGLDQQQTERPVTLMDPEAATKQYGVRGPDGKELLRFDQPVSEYEASSRSAMLHNELKQQEAASRASGSIAALTANFASGGASMITDPSTLLGMIPILGQAKWALEAGLLARTAVIYADNAIINTGFGVAEHLIREKEGTTETWGDVAQSIVIGTLVSGTLAAGMHLTFRRVFGEARPETHQGALQTAVAQMAEGRPVDVMPLYKADLLSRLDNDFARNRELVRYLREGGMMERDPLPGEPGFGVAREVPTFNPRELIEPVRDLGGLREPAAPVVDERIRAPLPEAERMRVHDTLEAAEKAARRYSERHDVRVEPAQTSDGKYILTRRINADLARDGSNEALTFQSERAAQRHIDTIIKPREEVKGGNDVDLAPAPNRYDVVPVGKVGSIEYAILKNADDRTVANWKKYPETVTHEKTRTDSYTPAEPSKESVIPEHLREQKNRPLEFADQTTFADDVQTYREARAKFERDLPGIVNTMISERKASLGSQQLGQQIEASMAKAASRSRADNIPGGSDHIVAMQKDAADLRAEVDQIGKVGELDETAKGYLKEAETMAGVEKRHADAMNTIEACMI